MKPPKILLALLLLFVLTACAGAPMSVETSQETVISNKPVAQSTTDQMIEPIEVDSASDSASDTDFASASDSASDSHYDSDSMSSNNTPRLIMLFGLESKKMNFKGFPNFIDESRIQLVRHNGLVWPSVESKEGDWQWQAVAELDEKLANTSARGLSTILIVRSTPEWAQMIPGSACSPIKPDKLESFAEFMAEAVSRYSGPPYNVKYWELGNEPDVDPLLVRPNSVFGCWGDQNDEYYGGGYYAEMLKVVYPSIKARDPEAKVLIGGLLLDCDPTHTPEGKDCTPGKFLEGILANGGGEFFDMVSFHGYAPYVGPESGLPTKLYFDDHHPSWEHRGGVVIGKVDFLREVMAGFNVDKPIFHTEGALLCPEQNQTDCDPPDGLFFEAQADYAIRMYVRNWANGVSGTIWYQFDGPGWRYGGLLDENQNPKPVYRAVEFLTTILSNGEFVGEIQLPDVVEGYEFISPDSRIWVLWSPDEIDVQIQLPQDTSGVFDKFGKELSAEGNSIIVNSPIFLVFDR